MDIQKIFISSGEASGDSYASLLIKEIKDINQNIQIFGMGGTLSRSAGMNTIVDSEDNASVMGFFLALASLKKILKNLNTIKTWLKKEKPNAIILIDFPDFNFQIAKYAKKLNIRVYYFIPPQVWAWRKGRVKFLKKYISHAVVIYPFEEKFYKDCGFDRISFLGHPFLDEFEKSLKLTDKEKKEKIISWGLDPDLPIVSIFPGSRKHEINDYLNLCLDVFSDLKEKHETLQGIISVAPNFEIEEIENKVANIKNLESIKIIKGDAVSIMQCSKAGLQKSGTNNFQACIARLPFLMFYSASKLTEFILKRLLLISEFSIVNILRPHTVKEFIQENLTKENLKDELERLLFDTEYRNIMLDNFSEIKESFKYDDSKNTARKAAQIFLAEK
ncbi:MAG: lipid-A-disaccharide synthase [Bdellovibrionota bacterium]